MLQVGSSIIEKQFLQLNMSLQIAVANPIRIVVAYVMHLFPRSSRRGRKKFIHIPNIGCIVSRYFQFYFSDTKLIALKDDRAQFEGEGALVVCMNSYQKQGNLRAWVKTVIGMVLTSCFDDTVGD